MMTFDRLAPDAELGSHDFLLDEEAVAQWSGLFPDDRGSLPVMPPAMIAMVVMRAFMDILHDRPRGNVHAAQRFWITRLPRLNTRLTTILRCAGKDERNSRRWVTFASDTFDAADPARALLFRGQMTTIWAA